MESTSDIHNYVLKLNRDTMGSIDVKDFKTCQKSLNEAVQVLSNCGDSGVRDKLLGITYNNLGCLYRKWKKPQGALRYLQLASQCEESALVDNSNRATTLLNICAVYSSIQQHESALGYCKQALDLLDPSNTPQVYFPTLVIAYHSTAVEHEFLRNFKVSLEFYRMAYELALKELGKRHPLTVSMGSDLEKAEKTIGNREALEVVKELNEESFVRSLRNRKLEVRKKMENFWAGAGGAKVLPYFGLRSLKEKTGGGLLRKISGQRVGAGKSVVKPSLGSGSKVRLGSNSPVFGSFKRKRGMVALPESIRASGMVSGFARYKSTRNHLDRSDEGISMKTEKSGSLKTKTLRLISGIEQIKEQIRKEGSWKLLQDWLNDKLNVETAQAVVRAYLLRKSLGP